MPGTLIKFARIRPASPKLGAAKIVPIKQPPPRQPRGVAGNGVSARITGRRGS
jgi:hypothetical protein